MSVVEPGSTRSNLIERARSILMHPGATWEVIEAEPATIGGLYRSYIMPLAAIPAVCTFVGLLLFGAGAWFVHVRFSPVYLIVQAVLSFGLSLALVFVLALVAENLAPNFGGTKDRIQAMKAAAYAPTAGWVAGVFALFPALSPLIIIGGLYSLYLLWLGLPKLMKVEQERAVGFFALVLVVTLVAGIVLGAVVGGVTSMIGGGPLGMLAAGGHVSGKVSVPGGSVDLGKLEEASKRAELAAKQMQDGTGPKPTDPEALKTYLPASISGYERGDVSASSGGAGGIEGSQAEGRYSKGDSSLTLKVTDMGSAAALLGMASGFNVHSSTDTATGYERVGKVNGRLTEEKYDRASKHGEYSVMVGERFMIQAEGDGVTMEELKAAVGAVPAAQLEGLAKAG